MSTFKSYRDFTFGCLAGVALWLSYEHWMIGVFFCAVAATALAVICSVIATESEKG